MNPGVACCVICWLAFTYWTFHHVVDIHLRRRNRRDRIRAKQWADWASEETQEQIAIQRVVWRLSGLARTLHQIQELSEVDE